MLLALIPVLDEKHVLLHILIILQFPSMDVDVEMKLCNTLHASKPQIQDLITYLCHEVQFFSMYTIIDINRKFLKFFKKSPHHHHLLRISSRSFLWLEFYD